MQITNLNYRDVKVLASKVIELQQYNPNIKMQIYHESKYDRHQWKKKYKHSSKL